MGLGSVEILRGIGSRGYGKEGDLRCRRGYLNQS